MSLPVLTHQTRRLLPFSVRKPGIMNYAAAAGGSREPPRHSPRHTDDASQLKPTSDGQTQKPRGLRQRSPHGHEKRQQKTGYVTRDEHKPNTGSEEELVYVLTLRLTDSLAKPMTLMREQYFPKKLNRTPAHLTLFHALPGSKFEVIDGGLSQLSVNTKPFFVSTGKPFRMRLGVGINVGKGQNRMKQVHEDLRLQWMPHLSEQDQGGWRPHWTIMNKVNEKTKVDDTLRTVEKEMLLNVREGQAVGLDLWRYDKGNWIFANEYKFKGP
jgi:mannose-1-phosphate guanylyltransferase